MDQHARDIWQGKSPEQTLKEAAERFHQNKTDPVGAHLAYASACYSFLGDYAQSRQWFALLRLLVKIKMTLDNLYAVDPNFVEKLTPDQADMLATYWVKLPRWFGQHRGRARRLLRSVLYERIEEGKPMKPHTRALMLTTLGELEWSEGKLGDARKRFQEALYLVPAIEQEPYEDRMLQLIRVLKRIGFFYIRTSTDREQVRGQQFALRAMELAKVHSPGQYRKIEAEWQRLSRAKLRRR